MIGDVCPAGSYCPERSITPTACTPGTFSSTTGNVNSSYCLACTPGYYCPNASTVTPLPCAAGYYCPLGSVSYELLCDEGYYCPEQSYSQQVRHNNNSRILIIDRFRNVPKELINQPLVKITASNVQQVFIVHWELPCHSIALPDTTAVMEQHLRHNFLVRTALTAILLALPASPNVKHALLVPTVDMKA